MRTLSLLIISSLLFLLSCNNPKSGFETIHINKYSGSVDLKLSDIISDIRIVPIETSDKSIVTGNMIAISDDYIVVADYDFINIYNKNGDYIRKVAERGNGPEEFNAIYSIFLDSDTNILYFTERDGKISRINLDDNKRLEPIITELYPYAIASSDRNNNLYLLKSGTISSLDPLWNDSTLLFATYNTITSQTNVVRSDHLLTNNNTASGIYPYKDNLYFINRNYTDTLYRITADNKLDPIADIIINNEQTDGDEGGETIFLNLIGDVGFILSHINIEVTTIHYEGGGYSSSRNPKVLDYFLYKNRADLKRVNSVTYDIFGINRAISEYIRQNEEGKSLIPVFPIRSGKYAYYKLEAFKMMELLEFALEEGKLNSSEKEYLGAILDSLNEDDNPVLIIGKIK